MKLSLLHSRKIKQARLSDSGCTFVCLDNLGGGVEIQQLKKALKLAGVQNVKAMLASCSSHAISCLDDSLYISTELSKSG